MSHKFSRFGDGKFGGGSGAGVPSLPDLSKTSVGGTIQFPGPGSFKLEWGKPVPGGSGSGCKPANVEGVSVGEMPPLGSLPAPTSIQHQVRLTALLSQQCGTVWLNSFKEPATSGKFGSNNPIPYIMVGTWDDYDEGSEIETGIDNCLSLSASITGVQGGVNSTLLAWAPSFSDTTTGTENTVSSYTVYDYNSGTGNLTAKAVSLPTTVHSVDVASLNLSGSGPVNGTHTLYVEAVGKPSIFNHLSPDPGVSWVAGYGRGSVTLEGCTGYDTLGNCTAIDPSIPAPYDNGSIAIQISGGSAGTCNVSVPYYAHAPREGLRDLVDKLSSAIASTPSCSSFVSAFPQANVLFLQSTAAGSTTNYTFQSSHAGTSILTIDSNGGVFRGGQ